MLDGLRAMCFDLDDTFWDNQRVMLRAEARLAEFLAAHYPRLAAHSLEELRAARLELSRAEPQRAYDLTWLRTEVLRRLGVAAGYPDAVGQQAFEIFFEARNQVELFPDVLPALDALGSRFTLATLSNGNADLQRIGIATRFVVRLNARDIGAGKPDPRAFGAVVDALQLRAEQVAYVGDDPHLDVHGARAAGLRTIWVNRTGREWPSGAEPADLGVADLAQLARYALAR
jgi:putative hydrolase of the HAD superfamily